MYIFSFYVYEYVCNVIIIYKYYIRIYLYIQFKCKEHFKIVICKLHIDRIEEGYICINKYYKLLKFQTNLKFIYLSILVLYFEQFNYFIYICFLFLYIQLFPIYSSKCNFNITLNIIYIFICIQYFKHEHILYIRLTNIN